MKQLLFLSAFFIINFSSYGQVHWLVNADSIPDCNLIKSGKFINKESNEKATEGYSIVFENGIATEYINNGAYYLKSRVEFISECKYKSTVIEVTIPNYNLGPGTIIQTEIINTATADNLVEIKSTINDKSSYFALQKIE